MQIRILPLAAGLLAATSPFAVCAQDTAAVEVRAGSPLLDASRVAARTDTFAVALGHGGVVQLVLHTAALGDTAFLRVERTSFEDHDLDVDSFAVRTSTLAPLYVESRGVSTSTHLTFPTGRVEGTHTLKNGEEQTIAQPLDAPVLYSNSVDLVLASLPLEAGRSFRLVMWSLRDPAEALDARVVRQETVPTVDGGQCDAWRVEVAQEDGTRVYWLEKRTHAFLGYSSEVMQIRIVHHGACPKEDSARRATR